MDSKKSMIIGILIGIVITLIGVGIYFLVVKDDANTKDDSELNEEKTQEDTNFVLEHLREGNSTFFYNQDIVSNNIKELDLKQGEFINIYLTGKEFDKQELVITNAIVGLDYENSSNSVVFLAPEEFMSNLKCVESISESDDYKVVVERVENTEGIEPELSNVINEFLSNKCLPVEDAIVEIYDN